LKEKKLFRGSRAGEDATDVMPILANPHIHFNHYGLNIYIDESQRLEQIAQNSQEVVVNHVQVRAAAAAWSLPPGSEQLLSADCQQMLCRLKCIGNIELTLAWRG